MGSASEEASGRLKFAPKRDDSSTMKAILSIGVYLALVFAIGIVMAMTAPRESREEMGNDDL